MNVKRSLMTAGFAVVLLNYATPAQLAHADGETSNVVITLNSTGTQLANQLGISTTQLQNDVNAQIQTAYQTAHLAQYIKAFSDATSFSSRGLGVDYASNAQGLILGIGATAAVSADNLDLSAKPNQIPVAGVAANVSGLIGLNLKTVGLPALTVYANGFYRDGTVQQLTGSIASAGGHLQWRIIGGNSGPVATAFKWGGIDLTAGFEYSKWTLGVSQPLSNDFVVGSGSLQSTVTATATGRFDVSSTTMVIPLEATTSVRLLYFLSLYGGVGFDFQNGTTTVNASLNGTLSATRPDNHQSESIGTATITGAGTGGPDAGKLRFIGGVQFNVFALRAFVQLNAAPDDTASVTLGLRLVL